MRKSIFALILLVGTTLSAQSTWKVDKAHSGVNFAISHLMISEVTGNFTEFDITATANDSFNDPSFEVEIKATSINTENERRDDHLRNPDFFEVETYPTITFKSTSTQKTGEKTFKVTGDLTMHGVTKPVTFDGKLIGIITDQRSNKLKAGLKLTGSVNRIAFNVGKEGATLGNEVDFTVNLEMAQQ